MQLINCEINLILTWSGECVLTSEAVPAIDNSTNATFKITNIKLYAPVVSLSIENEDSRKN